MALVRHGIWFWRLSGERKWLGKPCWTTSVRVDSHDDIKMTSLAYNAIFCRMMLLFFIQRKHHKASLLSIVKIISFNMTTIEIQGHDTFVFMANVSDWPLKSCVCQPPGICLLQHDVLPSASYTLQWREEQCQFHGMDSSLTPRVPWTVH